MQFNNIKGSCGRLSCYMSCSPHGVFTAVFIWQRVGPPNLIKSQGATERRPVSLPVPCSSSPWIQGGSRFFRPVVVLCGVNDSTSKSLLNWGWGAFRARGKRDKGGQGRMVKRERDAQQRKSEEYRNPCGESKEDKEVTTRGVNREAHGWERA